MQKSRAKLSGRPAISCCKRNGRGVGRDDRALFPLGVELAIELLLEIDALDDRLDDPIHVGELPEIVLDIARRDQPGGGLRHQRRRIGLQQLVDARPLAMTLRSVASLAARCRAAAPARRHWRSGRRCRCPSRRRRSTQALAMVMPPPGWWRCPGHRRCIGSRARTACPRASAAPPPCR